jgi:hypothetical protein
MKLGGAQLTIIIQMMIGALAFTVFCQVLSRFLKKRPLVVCIVFLLFDVWVVGWERTLLTEGLAISVSLVITAMILQILLQPTAKKFLVFFFLFTFGFLLRPSFILIPLASLPILAWHFRKQTRVVWYAIITLLAMVAVPAVYTTLNNIQFHYPGIQYVGDIDVLGKILEFHVPIDSAKNTAYFYTTVTDSRKTTNITMPFRFLERYDPAIYDKPYRFVQLHAFNQTVLQHTFPLYVVRSMGMIPEILLEVCDFTRVSATHPNFITKSVWVLQQVYGVAQYLTLLVPIVWLVSGSIFFVKPTKWNTLVFLIGTLAMSQIILTALTVYKDIGGQYGRVISIVRPHEFLLLFLFFVGVRRNKI